MPSTQHNEKPNNVHATLAHMRDYEIVIPVHPIKS